MGSLRVIQSLGEQRGSGKRMRGSTAFLPVSRLRAISTWIWSSTSGTFGLLLVTIRRCWMRGCMGGWTLILLGRSLAAASVQGGRYGT